MANFKIDIPDEKLDFVLELFNHFDFIHYQALDCEHSKHKELVSALLEENKNLKETVHENRSLNELKELRDTINCLQTGRNGEQTSTSTILFRFPHGTEVAAVNISTHKQLIGTIENYYKTTVTNLSFIINEDDVTYDMDKYIVMITLPDKTQIKAGYCNMCIS